MSTRARPLTKLQGLESKKKGRSVDAPTLMVVPSALRLQWLANIKGLKQRSEKERQKAVA